MANFRNYASKWTSYPHDGDANKYFNPAYPWFGNNCANFASQVIRAGGLPLKESNKLNASNTGVWDNSLSLGGGASRTWSAANYQYTYMYMYKHSGAYKWLGNIWNGQPGDLLYVDWDPRGKADGSIDHVMTVTGRWNGQPEITQKSPNRHNITLETSIALAKSQGKTKIVWYGLSHL